MSVIYEGGRFFVVTPVYEDVPAATRLFSDLKTIYGDSVYVVAVDDGSVKLPMSADVLKKTGVAGRVVFLKRNVGHQRALAIGLHIASEMAKDDEKIVLMDSDGEDRPESIAELLALLDSATDVVVATRKSRIESMKFKLFYRCYKVVFSLLTGRKIAFGNFMAMTRFAAKRLAAMQELAIHVAASVLASRLRIHCEPIDRGARYAGRSKMNFVGLVLHGFKGLMVFAEDVLVRTGILSGMIAAVALAGGVLAGLMKLMGFASQGWLSLVLGLGGVMLIQTGALILMMLMLTGIIRSGTVTTAIDYDAFIDHVDVAEGS